MRSWPASLIFLVFLLIGYGVYAQGLSGAFIFDDYANLPALGHYGGVWDWPRAMLFIFGGDAGPTGRPVALASFLLNAQDWPAPAASTFLYTNILLHLLTGCLLAWFAFKLGQAQGYDLRKASWVAALSAGLWLLHPLWVSTTLYAVQRMTILAALFMLAGLLAYTQARLALARGKETRAVMLMLLGIAGFGGLAILSKENGALLPLMALTLDITVLRQFAVPAPSLRRWRIWHGVFIKLPSALIVAYLLWHLPGFVESAGRYREFTFLERVFTQPLILFDYLFNLLLPRIHTGGLYHDHFPISEGLLSPPLTLIAMLGIFALITLGFVLRKTYPVVALAILFFFAGHLLESSVVPLELYFEHRNYFPAMMIFFAAAVAIAALLRRNRILGTALPLAALVILSALTYARASLWGSPAELALVWAHDNPQSVRAQTQASLLLTDAGLPREALQHIETGLEYNPDSIELNLQRRLLKCRLGMVDQAPPQQLLHALRHGDYSFTVYKGLRYHLFFVKNGYCPDFITVDDVITLINTASANPTVVRNKAARSNLQFLEGQAFLLTGEMESAKQAFDQAMALDPAAGLGIRQAALLASSGQFQAALAMLDRAENALAARTPDNLMQPIFKLKARFYNSEIKRIRKIIHAEYERG